MRLVRVTKPNGCFKQKSYSEAQYPNSTEQIVVDYRRGHHSFKTFLFPRNALLRQMQPFQWAFPLTTLKASVPHRNT